MFCCLTVYFLVVFKTVLRGLWMFGFVGLQLFSGFCLQSLGGQLTLSVTRLSLVTSRLVETQVASASPRAQVTCSSPFRPAFSLYSRPLYIRVHSRLENNFLIKLNLSHAYQQLELDEETQELLMVNTHCGLY